MISPKNTIATKWATANLLALATLTSCATKSHDALPTAAPYFANRAAVQPIRSNASTAMPVAATTPTFAPGHFATKSILQEVESDRQPHGMVFLRPAFGTEEIEVLSGTDFKNETDTAMVELGFEGTGKVMGGGFRLSARATDDNFFESDDSISTEGEGAHLFGHLTIQPSSGRFRMPIRIGPEIRANAILLDTASFGSIAELDWLSFGAAVEIEPEFDFFRSDRSALSVYGRAHVGAGIAQVSSQTTDYETESSNIGAEVGVRLQLRKFLVSGGYLLNRTEYAESDPENNFALPVTQETNWHFEGFFLMLGVRW